MQARPVAAVAIPDRIAASICWLNRWHARGKPGPVGDAAKRRHGESCAWCKVPDEEINRIVLGPPPADDDEQQWRRLSGKAQFARVRESQEGTWWDR